MIYSVLYIDVLQKKLALQWGQCLSLFVKSFLYSYTTLTLKSIHIKHRWGKVTEFYELPFWSKQWQKSIKVCTRRISSCSNYLLWSAVSLSILFFDQKYICMHFKNGSTKCMFSHLSTSIWTHHTFSLFRVLFGRYPNTGSRSWHHHRKSASSHCTCAFHTNTWIILKLKRIFLRDVSLMFIH